MAIQMRRGLKKDFDPNKMLPGEWAVSIDSSTSNQIVWMCFAPGVCKRMGTYEDLKNQIVASSTEIAEIYKEEFAAIENSIKAMKDTVNEQYNTVVMYYPDMKNWYSETQVNAESAKESEEKAKESAEKAQTALNQAGWGAFDIDENGHLIYFMTDYNKIDFALNNGRLEAIIE